MSSVPSGKRNWKCPECGSDVLLSVTQLDPIACEACVAKMKSGSKSAAANPVADAMAGPLGIWQGLPEMMKLAAVAVALVLGLAIGFVAGKSTGTPERTSHPSSSSAKESSGTRSEEAEEEERPEAPGPGYKWVRGRERKDGTRGKGHWAKDPNYKGDDSHSDKKKKE